MTEQQIHDEIISLLRGTGRRGIESVITYLHGSDFFTARCHHHHCFAGGLAQHSLETCRYALANRGDLPEDGVVLGSLLHDICTSHSPQAAGISGHGRRSVGIIGSVCHFRLSRDEFEAIKLHMHGDAREMATNALARLVFKADKLSARGQVSLD